MQLLERESAIAKLERAAEAARAGSGKVVLLSGEAGAGKSSLVRNVVDRLPGQSWVAGYCEGLDTPEPLGPFREIAARLGGDLDRLFKFTATPEAPDVLTALHRSRASVVVIEDLHWADQASLNLVRYVGRRVAELGGLLLLTYRNDELSIVHPLRRILGSLATSEHVSRIELQPLSLAAVRVLAAPSGHDPVILHERTGGNPFFVTEVLTSGAAKNVPHAVKDLVGARIAQLGDAQRDLLQLVALLGHAEPRLIRLASPTAPGDVDAVIAAGLLRMVEGTLAFPHELTRQAIVGTIAPQRGLVLHALALDALIRARDTDTTRLATHAGGARDAEAIARYAPHAAREAAAAGAYREAARHYQSALNVVTDATERATLLGEYGAACATLDQAGNAIAAYEEAAGLWRSTGDKQQEGSSYSALAIPLFAAGRNSDAARREDEAIALLEPLGPSPMLARALRGRAQLHMLERDKVQALHFGRRAIQLADAVGDQATLAAANQTVAITLLVSGDLEGRNYLERSMQLAREEGLDQLLSVGLMNAGSAYGEQYHFVEAERFLRHGIAFATEHDFDSHRNYQQAWLATVQVLTGQFDLGEQTAADLLKHDDLSTISRIMALVAIGRARSRRGTVSARSVLDEALDLASPTATLQRLAPVRLARAELGWLADDPEEAKLEADAISALAVGHRHQWHAAEAAYWLQLAGEVPSHPVWFAPPYASQLAGDWQRAAQLWEERNCPYEQARALSSGDDSAKLTALRIFDALGARPAAELVRRALRRSGATQIPRGPRPATRDQRFGLTARQHEIGLLLALNLTNRMISLRLKISEKTVEHHVTAILTKLEVRTRAEAGMLLAT